MNETRKGVLIELSYEEAIDFIMPKHYAGRVPVISKAFGWVFEDRIVAVCTFGKPATPFICSGICGKEYSSNVYELNRLVRIEEYNGQLSEFVGACLRELNKLDWIIVSYSDTGMNHHGYIYQACNFIYTGCTKQRTDKWNGKHARHGTDNEDGIRQVRTAKHRYIYFCTKDKKLKKMWNKLLKYPVLPYPKGDNQNYDLGNVYYPALIDKNGNLIEQDGKKVYSINMDKYQNKEGEQEIMKVSEHFKDELAYIANDELREIVTETLDASPECIVTIPASSSGRYHPTYSLGEGGLMRHIKGAVGIAHCMIETEIFDKMVNDNNDVAKLFAEKRNMYADAAYAALILHDCCKPDNTEKHGTQFDHPLLAANLFKEVAKKYINQDNMHYMRNVVPMVHGAIASHMGQFCTAPYAKGIVLPKPKTGVEQFVHMCDYLASRKFLIFDFDKYDYNSRG